MTITTHFHSNQKFKSIILSARFYIPFKRVDNTKLALLSELMDDRNINYPTKTSMLSKLDNLYGANLRIRVSGVGKFHQLEARLVSVSDQFIEEKIQDELIEYLSDILYSPLITQETLQEAKDNLRDKLNRELERPNVYAMNRALEIAGKDSTLSITSNGSLDDIEAIDLEQMVQFHEYVMNEAQAALFVVGNFDQERAEESIGNYFKGHQPLGSESFAYLLSPAKYERVSEELPIHQASLIKLYSTQINVYSELYHAYRIGTIILGQLPTSFLFQEVREKHSLAYSVGASTIGFDGVLYMNTQLMDENIELANQLMDEQLKKIKEGLIPNELLEGAKLMIANLLLSIHDDEYALLNFVSQSFITSSELSVEETIEKYQQVTIESIMQAFSHVKEILTYELRGIAHD